MQNQHQKVTHSKKKKVESQYRKKAAPTTGRLFYLHKIQFNLVVSAQLVNFDSVRLKKQKNQTTMRKFKNTPIVNYSFIESKAKEYESAGWRRLKRCHTGAIATLAKGRMRINILPSNAEAVSSTKK